MTPGEAEFRSRSETGSLNWNDLTPAGKEYWEGVATVEYSMGLKEAAERDAAKKYYDEARDRVVDSPIAQSYVDEIDAPNHYMHSSGVECRQIVEEYSYHIGTAMAYLWRHKVKHDDPRIDIKKAIKHLDFELERYDRMEGEGEYLD